MLPCVKRRRLEDGGKEETERGLPVDVELQIVAKLPAETVLRLRSVCQQWNAGTRERFFAESQFSGCKINDDDDGPTGFVFKTTEADDERPCIAIGELRDGGEMVPLVLCPMRRGVDFVGECDGLVCLVDDFLTPNKSVYLCNPLLRQSVELPYLVEDVWGFGYDPVRKQYKVLGSIDGFDEDGRIVRTAKVCSVSVAGVAGPWRDLGVVPYLEMIYNLFVTLNGRMHWCVFKEVISPYTSHLNEMVDVAILSFDLQDEQFAELSLRKLNLPRWHWSTYTMEAYFALGKLHGRLTLLEECKETGMIQVWTMKEYANDDSWVHMYSFTSLLQAPTFEFDLCRPLSCLWRPNGDLLIIYQNYIISYHPITNNCVLVSDRIKTKYNWAPGRRFECMPFIASLISLL